MRILYLSYDGLTGFLGQSQVWSYIRALASAGHKFDVVTYEHAARYKETGNAVACETAALGVGWHPRRFRTSPPVLAKIFDHRDMLITARRLVRAGSFDAIHARSFIAGDVALRLKREFGVQFIFDTRGFWADQKREGGFWPESNLFYRMVFRRWKAKERAMIAGADRIVLLTEAARDEIARWPDYRGQPIAVIPCNVDHETFIVAAPETRAEARRRLGIAEDDPLLVYLGSIGSVYLLREMLVFFSRMKRVRAAARFLLIGWHERKAVLAHADGLEIEADDIIIQPSEHHEVPYWLGAADLAISLIRPSYSSLGASPTKMAEYLACGLPVVTNDRVGDVERILREIGGGVVLKRMTPDEMDQALTGIDALLATDREGLRTRSRAIHDLDVAVSAYDAVYRSLDGSP